jgi:hypothetical protein
VIFRALLDSAPVFALIIKKSAHVKPTWYQYQYQYEEVGGERLIFQETFSIS